MKKKIQSLTILSILLAVAFSSVLLSVDLQLAKAATRTWTVDDDGPADFSSIQPAVNAATDGDTIHVISGTYRENITLNKAISLIGWGSPVIKGNSSRSTVTLTANGTLLRGFNVTSGFSDEPFGGGIELNGVEGCTVADNNAFNNNCGITLINSNNNTIANNTCRFNSIGIRLWSQSPLTSSNNTIQNNNCSENQKNGVELWSHTPMTWTTNNNTITNNLCLLNGLPPYYGCGIHIGKSNANTISRNTLVNNNQGIGLEDASNCKIFHNNFIINSQQAGVSAYEGIASVNTWDNGYPSGGNYWSGYNGTDTNQDGIGDTPYIIDTNNQDRYPLRAPLNPQPSTVQTTASVNMQPNPVGIGQTVRINMSITPSPPTSSNRFNNLVLRITRPDGTTETRGPFILDTTGSGYTLYTSTQIGTYKLQLNYSGQFFSSSNLTYLPASSLQTTLHVQQQPVPSGTPSPTPNPTLTPIPTPSPTPTSTASASPTPTPTISPNPTATPTPTETVIPIPTSQIPQNDGQSTKKANSPIVPIAAVAIAVVAVVFVATMLRKLYRKDQ